MMNLSPERKALLLFASLQRAAARKRFYAVMAVRRKQPDAARILLAFAMAEDAQARRIFNNLLGKIDATESFLETALEQELAESTAEVEALLHTETTTGPTRLTPVLREIRKARLVMRSLADSGKGRGKGVGVWQVCRFCGYLAKEEAPDPCPVCGAEKQTFMEVL